jgi:predicted SAM-dependent methyltransferase
MDLARCRNRDGQIWLNVASSFLVLPEYVNLDNSVFFRLAPFLPVLRHMLKDEYVRNVCQYREARERAQVMLHDCRRRLPFPAESVNHILCSHFLEHVYPDEAERIVGDFYRVLVPGGTLHVVVPSLDHIVDAYRNGACDSDSLVEAMILSSRRRPTLRFRVLEFVGYEGLKHRWMYDRDAITKRVLAAGFQSTELSGIPSKDVHVEDGGGSIHVAACRPMRMSA